MQVSTFRGGGIANYLALTSGFQHISSPLRLIRPPSYSGENRVVRYAEHPTLTPGGPANRVITGRMRPRPKSWSRLNNPTLAGETPHPAPSAATPMRYR